MKGRCVGRHRGDPPEGHASGDDQEILRRRDDHAPANPIPIAMSNIPIRPEDIVPVPPHCFCSLGMGAK